MPFWKKKKKSPEKSAVLSPHEMTVEQLCASPLVHEAAQNNYFEENLNFLQKFVDFKNNPNVSTWKSLQDVVEDKGFNLGQSQKNKMLEIGKMITNENAKSFLSSDENNPQLRQYQNLRDIVTSVQNMVKDSTKEYMESSKYKMGKHP